MKDIFGSPRKEEAIAQSARMAFASCSSLFPFVTLGLRRLSDTDGIRARHRFLLGPLRACALHSILGLLVFGFMLPRPGCRPAFQLPGVPSRSPCQCVVDNGMSVAWFSAGKEYPRS